jgi:hypothetical protein
MQPRKKRRPPAPDAGDGVIWKRRVSSGKSKGPRDQQVQQTGMLFMQTQQTQPALDIADMQSQQA